MSSLTLQDLLFKKIYEIIKEFKDFKFQQNLRIEFTKNDEPFKNKIFADPWFGVERFKFKNITIDEILDIQHKRLSSRVENWTYEVSGWTIYSIIQHQCVISEISPCEGSSYFPLPKEVRNPMIGLINIQNEKNECFRWCLVRYLNSVSKNAAKNRKVDQELDF